MTFQSLIRDIGNWNVPQWKLCTNVFNPVLSYLFRNRVNKKPNDEDWTFVLSAIRDPKCFDAVMIFEIDLQLYSGRIWSKWNLLMENDHNTL